MTDTSSIDHSDDLIPLAMLNAYCYCPRRFHYEHVQGVMQDNAHVVHGRRRHARVDDPSLAERPRRDGETVHTRSVWLSSEALGITGKIDVLEERAAGLKPARTPGDGQQAQVDSPSEVVDVVPVEYKKSRPPSRSICSQGYWPNDAVQLCAQALLLEANSHCRIDRGYLYFAASRQRVEVPMTESLRQETLAAIAAAKVLTQQDELPPPLVDSPKCPACSLVSLCMPDETNRLRQALPISPPAPCEPSEALRSLIPKDYDTEILYVTEQGATIAKKEDHFLVRDREGNTLAEVPGAKLRQICIYGFGHLTTQAVHACMDLAVDVAFFSTGGRLKGHLTPLPNPNGLLRSTVARALQSDAVRLAVAREVVAAKISNHRVMLMRNTRDDSRGPAFDADIDELATLSARTYEVLSRDELLGVEGSAGRIYFLRFNGMIRPDARESMFIDGRNRRPPRDPINALLSLAYACLCKDVLSAVAAVGLDPYLGALHQPRRGQPALALDLMEEFRPVIAESVVLTLINNRMVDEKDFLRGRQACNLTDNGRRAFFAAYERRKSEECTHPVFGYRTSYVRLLEMQARILARFLTGEIDVYAAFRIR
jgi:CRISPR-associated protein Cas1